MISKNTCFLLGTIPLAVSSFTSPGNNDVLSKPTFLSPRRSRADTRLNAITFSDVSDLATLAMSSINVATIDADIANIADDQFGLVFAGGIVVMLGGVFSALIVGGILNAGNSYGKVIVDSYIDGDVDEAFWSGLSDEEKVKAQELLGKIRESRNGKKTVQDQTNGEKGLKSMDELPGVGAAASNAKDDMDSLSQAKPTEREKVSIFSDYDD